MSVRRGWSLVVVVMLLAAGCSSASPPRQPIAQTSTLLPVESAAPTTSTVPTPTVPTPTPEPTKSSAPQDDWSQVLADVRQSVVRLSLTRCVGDPVMGSGFVVDDDLIVTAAHVVLGARTVKVQTDAGDIVTASPVAMDLEADSALLRADQSLGAEPMTLADQEPPQGSPVAALGFPLATEDLSISQGVVSSLRKSIHYQDDEAVPPVDQQVGNVFTTDAATNGGNSGGPVINHSGVVIGLVSGGQDWDSSGTPVQGINFIVPASDVLPRLEQWRDEATAPADPCEQDVALPSGHDCVLEVSSVSSGDDANAIALALSSHGEGINQGSYVSAWTLFTRAMQTALGSLDSWESSVTSSCWEDLEVGEISRTGDTALTEAVLRTEQDAEQGPDGQTCTIWLLNYQMKLVEGQWLIDHATPRVAPSAC